MAIYTRTGDAGSTSLFTGQRVSKTHPRVEAYGTLDELNAMLSLCVCAVAEEEQRTLLEALQQHIFWVQRGARQRQRTAITGVSAISAAKRLPCWSRPSIARWPACRRCTSLYCPDAVKPLAVCTWPAPLPDGGAPAVELAAEVTIRQILLRYLNRFI
ncbi:cob(I)alamin adenosyltransferase PduO [Klebsiella pneumoniae]|uniref:Corrinoid adenosyltransferase n=1 Tax=Klebsiella pneumoniae TaxID=573 RepID=A0A378BTR9_KLEPN|nr:cob(I)alamin adenosyltransferase PduO [Klebsiella pneumoniae]